MPHRPEGQMFLPHLIDVVPGEHSARRTCAAASLGAMLVLGISCARSGGPATTITPDTVRIAQGRATRDHATDAVGSVTAEELETMRVSRVEDLIRGRMAGVEVGRDGSGELTIRIRGAGNLGRGSTEPLIVVDGMPMSGRRISRLLDGLVPSDIARIDVLKDAGATAPYGILGANGVILITTKRR
jgi:TonB-dependent starch-binding outer membrane protein SusC